jgi:hypothetical protein
VPAAREAATEDHRYRTGVLALLAYGLLAFVYFGLPILSTPDRVEVGSGDDPNIFIWSFAWWPHALLHGLNPIYTHAIWAPSGYNLAWTGSIPGLALAFAPVTLLAGPVVAYNAAAILIPAFAAWTAFLLCRYLTRALWPSLVGGYLFGFSSYMLGNEEGHMHLTAVFLVPLVALVVLRYLDGALSRRGAAVRLGVLLAAQLSLSTEVFGTLTLAIAASLAIAYGLLRTARQRVRSLVPTLAAGYVVAAVVASPLVYYIVTGFLSRSFGPTGLFVTDGLNFVVPTKTAALGGDAAGSISAHFSGANELEQGAYLGLPLLVIVGLFFLGQRKTPTGRLLISLFAVATVASFGSWLHVYGHPIVPLPWWLVRQLPVFDNTYPARMMLYASLAAAVIVALWTASAQVPRLLRLALPALAIAALLPNLGQHHWDETPKVPAFFTAGDYKTCLAPGENVLAIPYGYRGHSLLWQALSGFEFRLAGGQIGPEVPKSFASEYSETHPVAGLIAGGIPPDEGHTVLALAEAKGVSAIVIDKSDPWPWTSVLTDLGHPKSVGGVLLYSIGQTTTSTNRAQCHDARSRRARA